MSFASDFLTVITITGISFILLSLLFIPLEKAFPAKKSQKIFRKYWLLDMCFFLGQYLFWSGLVSKIIGYFSSSISEYMPTFFPNLISGIPIFLQVIIVLFLSDFTIYWAHRLQHNVDFLWRFHKVHHSAKELDWLAAHREHPLDSIYTITLINLPVILLGFSLETVSYIITFRGIWAIYIHSNVRINIGFIKKIIGSPDLHHWHHDLERDRGNYANISPLMDILFGTYTCPNKEPKEFGIKEVFPQSYVGQLLVPFLPAKLYEKFQNKSK